MQPVKKILTKLNGLHYSQEYLCFAAGPFVEPIHVYLVRQNRVISDISDKHAFVGYCPLVFAFALPGLPAFIQLIFSQKLLQQNEIFAAKDALARLELKLIKEQRSGTGSIVYYEGSNGSHHFLSPFRQFIGSLYNNRFNKKPGNVFLHDNLYRQVQVAYSVPRNISLVTVGSNDRFNLFPTDLHGQIDEQHYIISLRVGGKACQQVMAHTKLLLSQMHADACKMVYSLGKNHMQELKTAAHFPFGQSVSASLQLPLPQQAIAYRELSLVDSFTHGIHQVMLFSTDTYRQLAAGSSALVHIHNSYATWRYKNRLPGNYLLR